MLGRVYVVRVEKLFGFATTFFEDRHESHPKFGAKNYGEDRKI
jgi:hypothetical protein